jgi:hypothetical protein
MSQKYLQVVHEAFTIPSGNCRVLVATSGQSVVSIRIFISVRTSPDVKIVCTAGPLSGRAIFNSNDDVLFVIFYEPCLGQSHSGRV